MADAVFVRDWDQNNIVTQAAVGNGELWQLPDGSPGYYPLQAAVNSGDRIDFETSGKVTVTKASGVVLLDGGRVYWDHSANNCTYKKVNDRDFYIGRCVGDAASGALTCVVDLSKPEWNYDIDIARDAHLSVITGTQALGGLRIDRRGGTHQLILSSTSEAQKLDLLSVDGFAKGAKAIVEMIFRVPSDGAGTVVDANIGIANATHATDADSITEHMFVHLDANNTNINLQSKDTGTTVASSDTTVDYSEGSAVANRVEVWFDLRTPADVQAYVNGVNVLPATVFNLDAVVGPLFLLAHLEKTSAADTYEWSIERLCARFAEQRG